MSNDLNRTIDLMALSFEYAAKFHNLKQWYYKKRCINSNRKTDHLKFWKELSPSRHYQEAHSFCYKISNYLKIKNKIELKNDEGQQVWEAKLLVSFGEMIWDDIQSTYSFLNLSEEELKRCLDF